MKQPWLGFFVAGGVAGLAAWAGFALADPVAGASVRGATAPCVFLVCGAPGDERHHEVFAKRLAALRHWFVHRAGVRADDVQVWYGPEADGHSGAGSRANVEKVCAEIVRLTKAGRPVWLVITGHANDAPGDVRFNVHGEDFSGKDLAGWLAGAADGDGAAPLTIILATACSGRAVRHLSAPGRAIATATNATEPADEPVFGDSLVEVLEGPQADADANGAVSLAEIFRAVRAAVRARYEAGGFVLTEHATLDGDGDGRATQRPSETDAAGASRPGHALVLTVKDPS